MRDGINITRLSDGFVVDALSVISKPQKTDGTGRSTRAGQNSDTRSLHMNKPGYADRAKSQFLSWAMGRPYHNEIDDECCPDFSCCYPDLLEKDEAARWRWYCKRYGTH